MVTVGVDYMNTQNIFISLTSDHANVQLEIFPGTNKIT